MKKVYICLAGLSLFLLAGCLQEDNAATSERPTVAVVSKAVSVADFPVTVNVGGTLRGDHQSQILSKVTSTVVEIPVRVGQAVKQGAVLVKLDPGSVQSQYNQAEATYRNAEKQYGRMKTLYEAGAISEAQLDAAETSYLVAQASFENAAQAVIIKAPFDGMVVDLPVRVGDEVQQGMKVVEIANTDVLRLILDVPTSQVGQLKKGQIVTVASPNDDGSVMKGEVVSVADAANTDTRSFEVECRFATPPAGFSPGVFVAAEIQTKIYKDALIIPNEALMFRGGKAQVYAVDSDKVVLVPVTVLGDHKDVSAVEGNLLVNQKVIVVGQKNLTPGTKVREASK